MVLHIEYARAFRAAVDMELVAALQFHVVAFQRGIVGKDEVYVAAHNVEHLVHRLILHHVVAVGQS